MDGGARRLRIALCAALRDAPWNALWNAPWNALWNALGNALGNAPWNARVDGGARRLLSVTGRKVDRERERGGRGAERQPEAESQGNAWPSLQHIISLVPRCGTVGGL